MKIKIQSDGTTWGTRVVDAETGEMVSGVQSIRVWGDMETEGLMFAELVFNNIELDIVAEVE